MPDIGSTLPSIQLFSTFYAHARRITNNIPTGLQAQERQRKGANRSRSEERSVRCQTRRSGREGKWSGLRESNHLWQPGVGCYPPSSNPRGDWHGALPAFRFLKKPRQTPHQPSASIDKRRRQHDASRCAVHGTFGLSRSFRNIVRPLTVLSNVRQRTESFNPA